GRSRPARSRRSRRRTRIRGSRATRSSGRCSPRRPTGSSARPRRGGSRPRTSPGRSSSGSTSGKCRHVRRWRISPGRSTRSRPEVLRKARLREGRLTPWLFLGPGLLLFVTFRVYPLLDGLYLSFTTARLGRTQHAFVGLANYERLLEDTRFHVSLWNTAFYTIASTLPILAIPLLLAVLLDRGIPLRAFLRSAFFFPFTLSVVTVGLAWLWLLDPVVGPFNYYLKTAGVPVRSWLADPSTAMWAIILTTVWWVTGYYLVIYLAGLQDIPPELYEAAALDGASGWRRFWAITLPLLRPVLLFVVVTHVIGSVQGVGAGFILAGGW